MSKPCVVGWDIGGVNTKVARVQHGAVLAAHMRPFEVQRDPAALAPLLAALAQYVRATAADRHAITMTAELSQMFRTKRDGVAFVLDAVQAAVPAANARVYTVRGEFVSVHTARAQPLDVAASNWAATAHMVALEHRNAILIDIGTTTTDIIPILDGEVAALGHTDPSRLASGELVYTGALRTPVEAIVRQVPFRGVLAGVSAEGFALAGDVHLWRGDLLAADYTVPTPDGRPATRAFAGERLARVVCGDREMVDDRDISAIANAVAAAQVEEIARAVNRVRARHPSVRTAVVTGLGAFLATAAARRAGLEIISLERSLGADAARCAPAAAVALLLERQPAGPPGSNEYPTLAAPRHVAREPVATRPGHEAPNAVTSRIDAVVKLGGALLSHPERLAAVIDAVVETARDARLVVVPGGGPFADVVRATDRKLGINDSAAHWMAVLAMDQYAELLASRHPTFALATTPAEIHSALDTAAIPILAPSRWLRASDPLPHSWDVTSDSIAAWVAGAIGAPRVVLVKAPGARGASNAVDRYFATALPAGVEPIIVSADELDALRSRLSSEPT